jgi:hypothetical protein
VAGAGGWRVRVGVGITFESPGLLFPYGFRKARFAHGHMRAEIMKYLNGYRTAVTEATT